MDAQLIQMQVDKYLEEITSASSSSRLRSPFPAKDITGFFGLVGQALESEQRTSGVQNPVRLMEDMPEEDDNITSELITYSIVERRPGIQERAPQSQVMSDRVIRGRVKFFRIPSRSR